MFVRINAEKQPAVAKKYGVNGYPTIKFLTDGGEEIHEVGGFLPVGPFIQEMDTARKKAGR